MVFKKYLKLKLDDNFSLYFTKWVRIKNNFCSILLWVRTDNWKVYVISIKLTPLINNHLLTSIHLEVQVHIWIESSFSIECIILNINIMFLSQEANKFFFKVFFQMHTFG